MSRAAQYLVIAAVLVTSWPALARDEIRVERVSFARGESEATISGSITGYGVADYVLGAAKGQTMRVSLQTSNLANYFNVLQPGAESALFIGSISGGEWTGRLPQDGDYTARVYLMRSAARRDETADYEISFSITSGPQGTAPDSDAKVAGTPFHATGNLPCSIGEPDQSSEADQCAFGVIRGAPGHAEIHVTAPDGGRRIFGVADGEITIASSTTPLDVEKRGDSWLIGIDDEHYMVPEAVVHGG